MIMNFSVSNFKSIRDKITLSFDASNSNDLEDYYVIKNGKYRLLKIGFIYGSNASGKTTILEALDFLRGIVLNPFNVKNEIFDYKRFAFDAHSKRNNSDFTIEFIAEGIKYIYNVELNNECIVRESLSFFNPNKAKVFERNTDIKKQLVSIDFGNKISVPKESKASLTGNTLCNNTVLGGFLKTNFDSKELQAVTRWFRIVLQKIITPKANLIPYMSSSIEEGLLNKDKVIKILNKADFGISDIIFKDNEYDVNDDLLNALKINSSISQIDLDKIRKEGKIESKDIFLQHSIDSENYLLSIYEESAGTKRYYEFSGLLDLIFSNETVVTIDELGSSLHPELIKHFILTFLVNSKNSQLIITTHFRELLLEKDILRNDTIWFTEKQNNGSTELFNLTDFNSSVIRNTSSIYNAYKIGKLGATPNLDDYYIEY